MIHKVMTVGIISKEDYIKRTMAIAKGTYKPRKDEPKIWFESLNSMSQVLSSENQKLLKVIIEHKPMSLTELEKISDRKKSNLVVTIKSLEAEAKRNALLKNKDAILRKLKRSGATDIQVLIQEIVLMTELGEKEVKIASKREDLADKRASLEKNTISVALNGQLALLKIQGASNLQIIKTTIEMEKKLGIERKGIEFLKQQLGLQQEIAKANKKTAQDRSKDLAKLIAKKRKQNVANNPFVKARRASAQKKQENIARDVGLTQKEIDAVIRPTEGIKVELPTKFENLTSSNATLNLSMGSLETAIKDLTSELLGKPINPVKKSVTGETLTPTKISETQIQELADRSIKIREALPLSSQSHFEQPKINQIPSIVNAPQTTKILIGDTVIGLPSKDAADFEDAADKIREAIEQNIPRVLKKVEEAMEQSGSGLNTKTQNVVKNTQIAGGGN